VDKYSDEVAVKMANDRIMSLLHAQVPITLLCDLADPSGPASAEIMAVEAGSLDPCALNPRQPALV
jgi:hypothetical protein